MRWAAAEVLEYTAFPLDASQPSSWQVLLGLNDYEVFNKLDHHTDLLLGGLVTNESLYLRLADGYSSVNT